MKREILCPDCTRKLLPMHPEDLVMGMQRRIVSLCARTPAEHGMTIDGKFLAMRSLVCDHCDMRIVDGSEASAVTWWLPSREGEPGPWEENYSLLNGRSKAMPPEKG